MARLLDWPLPSIVCFFGKMPDATAITQQFARMERRSCLTQYHRYFTAIAVFASLLLMVVAEGVSHAQCGCTASEVVELEVSEKSPATGRSRELDYADEMYTTQQFYRAVGEYERAAFQAMDTGVQLDAMLGAALSYHHGRQFTRAILTYRAAMEKTQDVTFNKALELNMSVARLELARQKSSYQDLIKVKPLLSQLETEVEGDARIFASFQLARLYLTLHDVQSARKHAKEATELCGQLESAACSAVGRLAIRIDIPAPSLKHPWLGATMSAIVPGAGALYAEHYVDGIYQFAAVASLGLMAFDIYAVDSSFKQQTPSFYALSGVGLLFYVASVIQGYSMTKRLNAIRLQKYHDMQQSGKLPPLLLDQFGLQARERVGQ
jgi:hypothetical protein